MYICILILALFMVNILMQNHIFFFVILYNSTYISIILHFVMFRVVGTIGHEDWHIVLNNILYVCFVLDNTVWQYTLTRFYVIYK